MRIEELEKLRQCLHNMLDSEKCTYEEILSMSQRLDSLMVQYMNAALSLQKPCAASMQTKETCMK